MTIEIKILKRIFVYLNIHAMGKLIKDYSDIVAGDEVDELYSLREL